MAVSIDAGLVDQLPSGLKQALLKKRLIPFVGAGVASNVLKNTGEKAFLTWNELLQPAAPVLRDAGEPDVAQYVEAAIGVEDPVHIAEKIRDKLSGQQWADFLQAQLAHRRGTILDESLELPKAIWSLAENFIITTDFDNVLEWAAPDPLDA
jgi:hypothetical protein